MAVSVVSVSILCCVLALSQNVAGTLQLDLNPRYIYPSLTKALDLNCTFSYAGLSNFTSIISLIISQADGTNLSNPEYAEIFSLNAFASDHVTDYQNHNAIIAGHLGSGEVSLITAHWAYPSPDEGGLYKCEAIGLDSLGHDVHVSSTVLVITHKPDLDQLINKVSELQAAFDVQLTAQLQLQQELANQNATIQTQAATIDALQAELGHIQTNLTDENAALQAQYEEIQKAFVTSMFEKSGEYNGRYYLLSKVHNDMANVSEAYCEYMGGYLAEIDDSAEHQFIKTFLYNYTFEAQVFVGGTDEDVEGQWVYRYSGTPLGYTNWYTSEPSSGTDYDCMYLERSYDWRMRARDCDVAWWFLCEVPIR